jgi:hypothetical protein
MTPFLLILSATYLLTSGYFVSNWLLFTHNKPNDTTEDKFLFFVILLTIAIFWFVAFAISCFKSFTTKKIEFNTLVPLISGMIVFTFYTHLH